MSAPVTLLMAMHCHQPVGNFGFVFDEAYAKAYDPFLTVLERHPGIRLALHYSGSLLDWLVASRPAFVQRLGALVDRGQVELLASGYYEPILPLIPEPDRQAQIARMRRELSRQCRAEARGLWLTERVWEPELPWTLAQAGIRYTMVDTNQFAAARPWLPAHLQADDGGFWDVLGCYMTEYAGASVVLFPASKRLRYWMPFQAVEQTIDFLRRLRRETPVAITFADDGEKFGLWPKTYHWVYEDGWLEQFFAAVERERDWLATGLFSEYVEQPGPSGTAYLPCGSYEEMLEWSGGQFRNFLTKYPEANAMYRKMLRVSRAVQRAQGGSAIEPAGSTAGSRATSTTPAAVITMADGARVDRAQALERAASRLYAGQCNCAYWHGVFGGLYLAHLRRAVHRNLIEAEELAAKVSQEPARVTMDDVDGDGRPEALLTTETMSVLVDPADGGTITEWNLFQSKVNVIDTLARRPEPYHEQLRAREAVAAQPGSGALPISIHDALGVKEDHLSSRLIYDDHRRTAFLDYGLQRLPTLPELMRSTWSEQRLWSAAPYALEPGPGRGEAAERTAPGAGAGRRSSRRPHPAGVRSSAAPLAVAMVRALYGGRIRKIVQADLEVPTLACGVEVEGVAAPVVGIEFNVGLCDARYVAAPAQDDRTSDWMIEEPAMGVRLRLAIEPAATVMHFPVETVSESEEGLERTYQGLCVMCLWSLDAAPSFTGWLRWTAEPC